MGTHVIGGIQQCVLYAVRRLEGGAYGVSIHDEIERTTGMDLSFGTIYSSLERLEGHGLVTSRMGEATPARGGRAKKYFDITDAGREALDHHERKIDAMR